MEKMNKRLLYITLWLASIVPAMGQQVPVFSLTRNIPVFYNPAMAGIDNETRLFVNYRQQWAGFTNAPETFLLGIEGRFNEKMAAALTLHNDITDIYGQLGGYAYYSYKIKLHKNHTLYLGLSAGLKQNRIYFDKIKANDPTEVSILENTEATTRFDAGAGLAYNFKNLTVQISALQITNQGYKYQLQSEFKSYDYQLIDHLFISTGYKIETKNPELTFIPEISARNMQGIPLQFGGSLTTEYTRLISLTLGYRQSYNFFAAINFNINQNISFAYAYERPGRDFRGLSYGSHEIMIAYKFSKGKDYGETASNKDWRQLKQQNRQLFQETEQLQQENERLTKQLALHDSLVSGQSSELKKLREIFENNKAEMQKVRNRYEIDLSEIDSVSTEDTLVKSQAYYVVLGAYFSLADAKFFQKVLEREIGLQTMVITREDGKYFFVYSKQLKNKNELNLELRRIKKMKIEKYIDGNIWIYGDK